MSKKDLRAYFDWFQRSIAERVVELSGAVREDSRFADWRPDLSPASLDALGAWFVGQVETRPKTPEELAALEAAAGHLTSAVEDRDLTNRTFSLAMDIGMYLSQVFLKAYPSLTWDQPLGSKRNFHYGQPVLKGFGAMPFNPVQLVVTLAYSIVSGSRGASGLREIHDIWTAYIQPT